MPAIFQSRQAVCGGERAHYQPDSFLVQDGMPGKFQKRKSGWGPALYQQECSHLVARTGSVPVSTRFLSCIGRNAREISKAQVWLGPSPVSTRMLTFAVTHRTNACDISSSESARMSNIFHITMRHFLVCNFPGVLRGFLEATSTSYRKIRGLLFPKVDIA